MSVQPIAGVPEFDRPLANLSGAMSYWTMIAEVNRVLKTAGLSHAAWEFRRLSEECDGDPGMLMTVALLFVRVADQEEV
jgi:hypothetical protein